MSLNYACRTIPAVLAVIAAVTLSVPGCAPPLTAVDKAVATTDDAGVRQWRIVYFGWDENELGSAVADDVMELAAANLPEDTFHCVVVRDSVLAGGNIELIRRGGTTPLPVPAGSNPRLFDPSAIAAVRRFVEETFPAEKEIVVVAAHGRGWRGIGSDSADSSTLLTTTAIPLLFGSDEASEATPRLAVFDVGYGASAEILAGLSSSVDRLVAAAGPRNDAGVDFERVGRALVGASDRVPALETAYTVFADEFRRTVPQHTVACTAAELAGISGAIHAFADAVPAAIPTRDGQNQVQSELLAAARVPAVPGDAFVSFGDVAEALGSVVTTVPEDLLLHLVHLDEIGVPAGHDAGYVPYPEETELSAPFTNLPWAPDPVRQRGVLFEIWYRQY